MRKILFVGAEALPFAATGGLGDVLGSLPAALCATAPADVRVILPLYGQIGAAWRAEMKEEAVFTVRLSWRNQYCGVRSLERNGVTYYFIDNEYYFKRGGLYGEYDDGERFAYFCMAALETLSHVGFYPDVLHAHDWQAALCVVYLNRLFRTRAGYENIRTVFTVHNIEYQGQFDFGILGDVFALDAEQHDLLDWGGCINLMKGAILTANYVTTVSPRYAEEICTAAYGHGLHPILRAHRAKLRGILNGIDDAYYNPAKDTDIPARFDVNDLASKAENKRALQAALSLPVRDNVPLLAVISRLAAHKGLDLIRATAERLFAARDVQFVVLGCGEAEYEGYFRDLERRYPDRVRALITYDRALAKRIYAACDVFLMPSRSEPCGLSQMIASRYGAIPVTHEVGGLADSIHGYWEENGKIHGNGFTFVGYRAEELFERTVAAIDLWHDVPRRTALQKKILCTDFSWKKSAADYLRLYDTLFL